MCTRKEKTNSVLGGKENKTNSTSRRTSAWHPACNLTLVASYILFHPTRLQHSSPNLDLDLDLTCWTSGLNNLRRGELISH